MAQEYVLPTMLDQNHIAVGVRVVGCLEALRTCHAGSTEPTVMVPFMLWADTASSLLKIRNAANTAWNVVAPIAASLALQLAAEGWATNLAATKTDWIGTAPRACTVKRLVISSSSASSSSSGNEWQVQLKAYPASAPGSPVNLFSGTVGTFTTLGGVGGGELVANAASVFVPDQNASLADLDKLELVMTKVGTATTLNSFRAHVEVQ